MNLKASILWQIQNQTNKQVNETYCSARERLVHITPGSTCSASDRDLCGCRWSENGHSQQLNQNAFVPPTPGLAQHLHGATERVPTESFL